MGCEEACLASNDQSLCRQRPDKTGTAVRGMVSLQAKDCCERCLEFPVRDLQANSPLSRLIAVIRP